MAGPEHRTPEHRAARARFKQAVDTGHGWCAELVCLMPSRFIAPGSKWDAAHDRTTGGYLGPAHARCNRAEGGRQRHIKAARPRRWSL